MASFHQTSVGPEFFNRMLSEALRFNFPDLVKNREGRLAPDQLRRLLQDVVMPLKKALTGCAILFTVYIFLARFVGKGNWLQLLQTSILLAIAAGLVKFSMQTALLIGDLIRGKVMMAEGRLEPSWNQDGKAAVNRHDTGSRTIVHHRFAVGGEKFVVPESIFRILVDNFEAGLPTVRVYYTPSSKKILSMEAISVEELVLRPEQMKKKRKPVSIWKSKLES
jgi:hypothetical protein